MDTDTIIRNLDIALITDQHHVVVEHFDLIWERLEFIDYDFLDMGYDQRVYFLCHDDDYTKRLFIFYVDDQLGKYHASDGYSQLFRSSLLEYGAMSFFLTRRMLNDRSVHNLKDMFPWDINGMSKVGEFTEKFENILNATLVYTPGIPNKIK